MQKLLLPLVAAFLPFLSLPLSRPAVAAPIDDVRTSVDKLHSWIGEGNNGTRWRTYLMSAQLEKELDKGDGADLAVVSQILGKYRGKIAGLQKSRFQSVRNALQTWIEALTPPEKLPELVNAAKDDFRPVADDHVSKAGRQLKGRISALNKKLSRLNKSKADGWRNYLQLAELEGQIAGEASGAKLRRILDRYRGDSPGLEMERVVAVRESLRRYWLAVSYSSVKNLDELYNMQLGKLAELIEAYNNDPSPETATSIGQILGFLTSAQQADGLVHSVRTQLAQPNLFAKISKDLIAVAVDRDVNRTQPVSQNSGGAQVSGTATTTGKVGVAFVPTSHRATVEIKMVGTNVSNTVAKKGPVRVFNRGNIEMSGSKRIIVDSEGVDGLPAKADCNACIRVTGICAPPIIRRIAQRAAAKSMGKAQSNAERQAEQQLRESLDDDTVKLLADANEKYRKQLRNPLIRRSAFPPMLRMSTTADAILVKSLHVNDFQLAAPSAPPTISDDLDLSVQLHETVVANVSESAVGNDKITSDELVNLLKQFSGEVPKGISEEGDWSITFAATRPIAIEVRENTVKIVIRGKEFARGSQVVPAMEIWATYKVARGDKGLTLTRVKTSDDGEESDVINGIEAKYLKKGRLNIKELAVKTFMRKRFGAMLKQEFAFEGLELPGPWEEMGAMNLSEFVCDKGWLALGWHMPESKVETKVALASD